MKPTDKKALKISEVVKQLEECKKEHGDIEVLITNATEGCFDGVGRTFVLLTPRGDKFISIMRNDIVIKI